MNEETPAGQGDDAIHDRQVLRTALCAMSVDQLRELRSTIVRLKHLPFTKLTEVLFTEPHPTGDEHGGSTPIHENSHVFIHEFSGHCESEATRRLFEDVEKILRLKEEAADQ